VTQVIRRRTSVAVKNQSSPLDTIVHFHANSILTTYNDKIHCRSQPLPSLKAIALKLIPKSKYALHSLSHPTEPYVRSLVNSISLATTRPLHKKQISGCVIPLDNPLLCYVSRQFLEEFVFQNLLNLCYLIRVRSHVQHS